MSARPWYPFYARDYRDKTADLTFLQDCAYRRLMDHYYITEKPLPANAELLHRICRAFDDAERASIDFVLARYFIKDRGVYRHDRIDEELQKAQELSETRAKAANSRYAKARANGHAIAEQKQTHPLPHPHKKNGTEEGFNKSLGKNGNGSHVTIKDPSERLARFQKTIADSLGREGWGIVAAAADPTSSSYVSALEVCKRQARTLGKGWPTQWPK